MLIRKDILLTAIMTLLAIQGCTEDEMSGGNTRWCEVEASFEETLTRVGLSTMENSRNLVAQWQEGDQINVILCTNDKYYEVGPVPVREISNDGRSCKFSYRLPENFKEPSDGYQLMCFTSNCQPKIIDNEVYYNGSLIRRPISQFKASVMSDEHASSGMFQSNFRHYYTYELLHISNKSDKDIDFALCAYSADLIWYRTLCAVRNWDGRAVYPSEAAQAAIEESPTVKIPANGSDIIVSAYIPNGQLIKNAKMTAKINGEYVYTSNLLSSDKELERGHAYHMYATWDGESLSFDKGDIEKHKLIKVEPTEIDFGRVPVGTTKTEHFTVSNVGTADLTFSVEEIHGEFDIPESGKEFTLAPEETKIFDVTFTPSEVDVSGGPVVDIYSDAENGMQSIGLSGTGGEGGNPSCPVAEAIDLGLPSGTLWASWNVGASSPEEYGGYYSWGETEEKEVYDWSTYTHCDGSAWTCHHIGDDIAGTQYDVAHVKWGGSWRMPTSAQQDELRENCTRTWTQQNGVIGTLVTGPNGATIFLPAAGHRLGGDLYFEGGTGSFWSSSLPLGGEYEFDALFLGFGSYYWNRYGYNRYGGFSVRPVCTPEKPQECPVAEAIDLGLPSGTKWASWNVGASKPEEYGGYYAWGETEEKDYYDWSTYIYCDGSSWTCHHIGDDIAGTEYDVAHVKWGGSWCMPTRAQQDELRENCTREWTQQNGVNGIRVTGPNGNSIFLPAAGRRWDDSLSSEGSYGYYWSSSLNPYAERGAYYLYFNSGNWDWYGDGYRNDGLSVRAVCP